MTEYIDRILVIVVLYLLAQLACYGLIYGPDFYEMGKLIQNTSLRKIAQSTMYFMTSSLIIFLMYAIPLGFLYLFLGSELFQPYEGMVHIY